MALNVRDSNKEVLGVFPSEVCPVCVRCNQALRSPEWRSQERICLASDWLGVLGLSEAEKGRVIPKAGTPGDVTHWFVEVKASSPASRPSSFLVISH